MPQCFSSVAYSTLPVNHPIHTKWSIWNTWIKIELYSKCYVKHHNWEIQSRFDHGMHFEIGIFTVPSLPPHLFNICSNPVRSGPTGVWPVEAKPPFFDFFFGGKNTRLIREYIQCYKLRTKSVIVCNRGLTFARKKSFPWLDVKLNMSRKLNVCNPSCHPRQCSPNWNFQWLVHLTRELSAYVCGDYT